MPAAPAPAFLRDFAVGQGATPSNSLASKFRTVSCPAGRRALGAGAFLDPALGNLGINRAAPLFDLVEGGGVETDSIGGSWSVGARAFCATNTPLPPPATGAGAYLKAVSVVTAQSANNSASSKTATAACPAGKRVIAGGGRIHSTTGDVAFSSLRRANPTQWRVTAHEVDATSTNWRVEARAVCANTTTQTATSDYVGHSLHLVQSQGPPSSAASRSRNATCPTGTYIVGGGARVLGPLTQPGPSKVVLGGSVPITQGVAGTPANTWIAEAHETDPTGATWRVQAWAVCAPLNGGPPGAA